MRILAMDDEKHMLDRLLKCIDKAAPEAEVIGFQKVAEARKFVEDNPIDVAFLDIEMRGTSGLEFSKFLKQKYPRVNIIFCTGYSEYLYDAINKIRCSGYILKPVTPEQISEELKNLRIPVEERNQEKPRLYLQCFGNFDAFLNGTPLKFPSAKSKELLAYLTDRRGAGCSTKELQSCLWDDDHVHESYLKKARKELLDLLAENGLEDVVERTWGSLALRQNQVQCDYFDWLEGKPDGINRWNGEYMNQYSWAEMTRGYLTANVYGHDDHSNH